jgi:hypothetical protein
LDTTQPLPQYLYFTERGFHTRSLAKLTNLSLKQIDGVRTLSWLVPDRQGDACDCTDRICTEGTDINQNLICDPEDPACDTIPPATQIILQGDTDCGDYVFGGNVNISFDAFDNP